MRSTPETEWDPQQLAWMVALEAYEQGLCRRCGQPLDESTDPGHDFNNPLGRAVYVPVPGMPVQCHCCAALDRSEKAVEAMNPQHPQALLHAVHLVPRG